MPGDGYADVYRDVDFRRHPELYRIGRGEQGVLIAEPYKSEILPHWRFKDVIVATASARKITALFKAYLDHDDFVGADMARKFLQMGFTRARRYANHADGRKYVPGPRGGGSAPRSTPTAIPQARDWESSEKAAAATVFLKAYRAALRDSRYLALKKIHQERQR